MSYIVAIATFTIDGRSANLQSVMPEEIELLDASLSPLGMELLGSRDGEVHFAIVDGNDSNPLVMTDSPRNRTLQSRFTSGIGHLVKRGVGVRVTIHRPFGDYWSEPVDLMQQVRWELDEFVEEFPDVGEDRCIVVDKGGRGTLRG